MRKPCKCGCGLPVGEGKLYLDQNHKQRAYRSRQRNQRRALSKYISSELVALLGDEKSERIFHHLNKIGFDTYNFELDKALAIVLTELRRIKTGVEENA